MIGKTTIFYEKLENEMSDMVICSISFGFCMEADSLGSDE